MKRFLIKSCHISSTGQARVVILRRTVTGDGAGEVFKLNNDVSGRRYLEAGIPIISLLSWYNSAYTVSVFPPN